MEGGFSRRGIIDKRGSTRPTPYYLLGNTGKTAGAVGLRGGRGEWSINNKGVGSANGFYRSEKEGGLRFLKGLGATVKISSFFFCNFHLRVGFHLCGGRL